MKKPALLLSLLALGALGLVACGGGDDDETTAASETEPTPDEIAELAVDKKPCGAFHRWRLVVAEGDISCPGTRRVMRDFVFGGDDPLPASWICSGPDGRILCWKELGASSMIVFTARFGEAASPPPTPADVGPTEDHPLVARHTVTEQGVPFSFRVPVGHYHPGGEGHWEGFSSGTTDKSAGGPISINKSMSGPQDAEAIIFWTSFPDGDYADPCARLPLSPPFGSSAADLAAAVSTAPGTELLTGPSNVTLGGRPAKHVALTVRENVGCNPGFFYTWRAGYAGAFWLKTRVGDTIRVWIVDVHGTRLFIEAETAKGYGFGLERDVKQIVESIRFE